MGAFTIVSDMCPASAVVHITADLDLAIVPEVRDAMDDLIDSGCSQIVLDLVEVAYADSSALGLLVWLNRRLAPIDGRLVLAGASRDVTRVLELSGLIQVAPTIATSPNVEAALEGLALPPTASAAEWSIEREIPASLEELADARTSAIEALAGMGFPEAALFDLKVALGEALANAVRHGSAERPDRVVRVRVIAHTDRVVFEVEDAGPGFDGTHEVRGDLYAAGGRGVMFMRALMDRVEFEPSPMGGTLVRLTKHRIGAHG